MEYTINQIIDYYANASIEYVNILTNQLQPYETDSGRFTAPDVSGIVISLSGSASFFLNDKRYVVRDGTIIHAGSKMKLVIETIGERPCEYAVVHYRSLQVASSDLNNLDFSVNIRNMAKVKENIYQLIKYSTQPGNSAKLQAKVLFLNLINEIISQAKLHVGHKSSSVISRAVAYIQENYADQISIAELAEWYGIERRRFSELFEQHSGLSPIQYLTDYRMRIAKELLRGNQYSIAEIAEQVGYQDGFYFSRVFKKYIGMSPSKYKRYMEENNIYF